MTKYNDIILAIDTSQKACSAALSSGGQVICAKSEMLGRGHAERLLPMIEELMDGAAITHGDIARIAVITGPGAYTGVRIGVAAARGFALANNIPCLGFTALEVAAARDDVLDGVILSTVAGRGVSIFSQRFRRENCILTALDEPQSLDIEQAFSYDVDHVVGSGRVQMKLDDALTSAHMPDCYTLAILAAGAVPEEHLPEPTYFRAADALPAKVIFELMD